MSFRRHTAGKEKSLSIGPDGNILFHALFLTAFRMTTETSGRALHAVFEKDAVESELQRSERALADLGLQLTLPHGDAVPPHRGQFPLHPLVALDVPADFRLPELRVRFRQPEIPAFLMPVPEAAVDEDTCAVSAQHDVGTPRQPPVVQTVTEAVCEEIFPHNHLRLGVGGMYGRHVPVTLFRG